MQKLINKRSIVIDYLDDDRGDGTVSGSHPVSV